MNEEKLDRRVQFTRNALREAFIDLAAEKPLRSITVTNLCARADINRSTFYLHYQDVNALLREIEDLIIRHIRENLTFTIRDSASFCTFLNGIRGSTRMIALMRALLGETGDPQFVSRLQRLTYEFFQRSWNKRMPQADERYKRLLYTYAVASSVACLGAWVSGDLPDLTAEQLTETLGQLLQNGLSNLTLPQKPQT